MTGSERNRIVGILLAAGGSRRFGENKLTQPLAPDETVAMRACRHLQQGTDHVLAVVRPGQAGLAQSLLDCGAQVEVCVDAEQGMGVSLAFAISRCPPAAGFLIALADMPWIAPVTVRCLAEALRKGALLVAPTWQGQRGHPVGFSATLAPELTLLHGDSGAKSVIESHLTALQTIECDDPAILWDIDRPQDMLNRSH